MTLDRKPPAEGSIKPELVATIQNLSEERQVNLIRQLRGDLSVVLLDLIRELSPEEQLSLLAQLQEDTSIMPNQEETEIALRRHSRRSCMITTGYMVGGRNFEGFILDISQTGAFIETDEAFSAGQLIQLAFSLPNAGEQFRLTGEILWKGNLGIGIQFKDLPRPQSELITAFMEKR